MSSIIIPRSTGILNAIDTLRATRPAFLWVPDGNANNFYDQARGKVGVQLNGAIFSNGGLINPLANGTRHLSFQTNAGVTGTSEYIGVMLVSIVNPAAVTGVFLKIGDGSTGVGFGGGNNTFEDSGSKLVILREAIEWRASSTTNNFVAGLNLITFGRTSDGVTTLNNVTTGSGVGVNANLNNPSSVIQINGYTVANRGSNAVVHAVSLSFESLTNTTYSTRGAALVKPFEPFYRMPLSGVMQQFNRRKQVLYFDVGGSGTQTLAPSLYVDGDTFHAATVSAGAVTLAPSIYSDGDTFHAATVTLGGAAQNLTPALFADGDTFHSATVAAGSVNLAPSLATDGDTFHAATVSRGSVTLTPSLVSDGDTFYTHAVVVAGGPQTLSPDLVADGDTFHAATVVPGAVTLTPSLYTDADTFHAAAVASSFNLQPPAYADPDTFYPATVAVGAVNLAPDLFVDGDAFHSPTVSLASTQTLTPDLFADSDTFYVPTLTGGTVILGAARSAGRQFQTGARSNIQTNRR